MVPISDTGLDASQAIEDPFWHLVQDGWVKEDLYSALAASFPTCPPASGPSGYTMFWGDPDYDELVASNPAWQAFWRHFHSQAFIDELLQLLKPVIQAECRFDLARARYVPYQETREEKKRLWLRQPDHAPDELWVRVDIMQGREGYTRAAHLDHRRRLASMLIYMSDPEESDMTGGDLVLHGHAGDRVLRPQPNRMVLFPCHKESKHSVTPIRSQSSPRNFVQVTVSSSHDLWKPGPPLWQRAARQLGL
jgi:hypothetical protein